MRLIFSALLVISVLFSPKYAVGQETAIRVGAEAPDILLPGLDGKEIALSSQKGKVVLVDFWASWCGPCVEEQPELRKLYRAVNQSGAANKKFEIFGVSLDSKMPAWKAAIKKHHINWIQVSDLKFWTSPIAKTYEIEALPFNVLLNKEGTIIAINLHGKELEEAVKGELNNQAANE